MRPDLIVGVGLAAASIAWWLATAVLAVRQRRSGRSGSAHERSGEHVGVSVIVPVASPAPEIGACLRSLCAMDYSPLEILLVVAAEDRAAVAAIEREAAAAAAGLVRCIVVRPLDSPNPKVGILAAAIGEAAHDLLLFTDDNAISPRGRVQAHLQRMHEGFSLVSAAVVGVGAESFWAQVDAAFMNGYFARLQLAGDATGNAGVLGKSMLVRRSDITRSGGLLATGGTLSCEDAALQKQVTRAGGRTALSREPLQQMLGRRSVADVWARHRRWFFCRWNQVPAVFLAELVSSSTVGSLAGALVASALGGPWWAGAVAVAAALLGIELTLLKALRWPVGPVYPLVWLAREALVLPLGLASLLGGSVVWRNRRSPLTGITPR